MCVCVVYCVLCVCVCVSGEEVQQQCATGEEVQQQCATNPGSLLIATHYAGAAYGDPHLITLDGGRYTFNGKGVFYLVKTVDDSFEVQVRLVQALSRGNTPLRSTVIEAVAAKEYSSNTVVFEASTRGLRVIVEEEYVELILGVEQHFTDVTLLSEVSTNRVAATFSSGAFVEVRQENGFVAVLMVSLPQRYKNFTQGLLGTFTGSTLDDFVPRTNTTPVSINASREVLHNQFASTCELALPKAQVTAGPWPCVYTSVAYAVCANQ